ncbi:MAG TPA: acyltransferase [Candidatus Angelobacter sp.]|nr:acyltransferase [Candidatus Angelobacter sp.]
MSRSSPASKAAAKGASKARVPGIDVLRGLCIVAVVLHHLNLRLHFHESAFGRWIGPAVDKVLFWNGYYGVRVFFVISGFLIASWSMKRWGNLKNIDLRQFYWMRFARIIPCLAGLLLLLFILDRAGVPRFTVDTRHTSIWRALLAASTFHINWLEAKTGYLPAAWDVLWSLSVEEMFYILFPVLCLVAQRWMLVLSLLVFVVIGPFARVALTHNDLWADYGYLSCMDGIAFGCLAAMVAERINAGNKLPRRASLLLLIPGIFLSALITIFRGMAAKTGLYKVGLDVTVLEIGVVFMLLSLQFGVGLFAGDLRGVPSRMRGGIALKLRAWHPSSILQWFGRNSYEIYLTHMLVVWPVVFLFQYVRQPINTAPLWFLGTLVLCGLLGHIVSRFYSEPLNQRLRQGVSPISQSRTLSSHGSLGSNL